MLSILLRSLDVTVDKLKVLCLCLDHETLHSSGTKGNNCWMSNFRQIRFTGRETLNQYSMFVKGMSKWKTNIPLLFPLRSLIG